MSNVVLVVENIRSSHNIGSLLRTADGLGLKHVYLTGYTPHPPVPRDSRLPHEQAKVLSQIQKTALGAEEAISWSHEPNIDGVISQLKIEGYFIIALEQCDKSIKLNHYKPTGKIALIVGNEVEGVSLNTLNSSDLIVEIPMAGTKESFNVVIAAAIALYHLVTPS